MEFLRALFLFGDYLVKKKKDRELTKKLISDSGLDWAFFNYASPLRGSDLYRQSIKNNWIPEKYKKLGAIDMTDYILEAGIDKKELEEDMLLANLEFNFVKNKRFRIGDYDTSIRSFFEVVSRHYNHPFAHFCLARSFYFKHEKVTDQVQSHLNDFYDIIDKDILIVSPMPSKSSAPIPIDDLILPGTKLPASVIPRCRG